LKTVARFVAVTKKMCIGRLDQCARSELKLRKVRFTNPQMDEISWLRTVSNDRFKGL